MSFGQCGPTWVVAACRVGPSSGESWRLAPAVTTPNGTPAPSVATDRFSPPLRLSTGDGPALSPPQGAFGDTPIGGNVSQPQADDPVVGGQRHLVNLFGDTGARPLLEPTTHRGVRTPATGDTFIARSMHQGVDEVLEDHPVRDTPAVTAQRMGGGDLITCR